MTGRKMREGTNGWTRWVKPLPSYLLGCCDCGLVHNIEFKIVNGTIRFRAQRNVKETEKLRKHV